MSVFSIALVLFLTMDPIGNIAYYLSLVSHLPQKKQNRIIVREMLIALSVMLGFNFLGEYLFDVLDISEVTVRIASGVILFLIAMKILFSAKDSPRANLMDGEPFIFPLAIPLIAGPALMATIMLYAHIESSSASMLGAIMLAWLVSSIILFFSRSIKAVLKESGLNACERLIGMVLVLIAVQRFLEGINLFWAAQH